MDNDLLATTASSALQPDRSDPGSSKDHKARQDGDDREAGPYGHYREAKRHLNSNIDGNELFAPCRNVLWHDDFDRIGTATWLNDGYPDFQHVLRAKDLARRRGMNEKRSCNTVLAWVITGYETSDAYPRRWCGLWLVRMSILSMASKLTNADIRELVEVTLANLRQYQALAARLREQTWRSI